MLYPSIVFFFLVVVLLGSFRRLTECRVTLGISCTFLALLVTFVFWGGSTEINILFLNIEDFEYFEAGVCSTLLYFKCDSSPFIKIGKRFYIRPQAEENWAISPV